MNSKPKSLNEARHEDAKHIDVALRRAADILEPQGLSQDIEQFARLLRNHQIPVDVILILVRL